MARLRSLTPRVWSRRAPRARVDGARYDIISLGPVGGLAAGVTHRFRRAERWRVTAAANDPKRSCAIPNRTASPSEVRSQDLVEPSQNLIRHEFVYRDSCS
jgi:hypothetical protein